MLLQSKCLLDRGCTRATEHKLQVQGLDIEHSQDARAEPARRSKGQAHEAALPPRSPTAARTLLQCDFDKTLTDWDAGRPDACLSPCLPSCPETGSRGGPAAPADEAV